MTLERGHRVPTDHGSDQTRVFVYFFGDAAGQRVKIGKSINPRQRIKSFADAYHFFAAVPGTEEQEKQLHSYFEEYRDTATKEWFWWRGEVRDFVEHVARQPWAAKVNDSSALANSWAPDAWLPWMTPSPREYESQGLLPFRGFDWSAAHYDNVQSDDYYTRSDVIALVRSVLGTIELDPASHPNANLTVGADRFFTIRDDGLQLPWVADTVFCNPPFSIGGKFALKLHGHYEAGDVGSAILLLGARQITTNWFQPLFSYPFCITKGRLEFDAPNGKGGNADAGHVLIYMGPDEGLFAETFASLGTTVRRVDW